MRAPDDTTAALEPPRGDADGIRAAARRLRSVTAQTTSASAMNGDVSADLSLAWVGAAASMAQGELTSLRDRSMRFLPGFAQAADALDRYAAVVEHTGIEVGHLQRRQRQADEQHRLDLARADLQPDPATRAKVRHLADEQHERVTAQVRSAYGAAMDALSRAGIVAAGVLNQLSDAAVPPAALTGDLPLVSGQVAQASVRPVGRVREGFYDELGEPDLFDRARQVGAWTYNHTAVPVANSAAQVVDAIKEHPEDVAEMLAGAGLIVVGGVGTGAAGGLDATGFGVAAGVPLHVASARTVAAGATAAAHGAIRLGQHAAASDAWWLAEARTEHFSLAGKKPGDPLPDSWRPEVAGKTWKGRVARDGNGEVWQDPLTMAVKDGESENKNVLRIKRPDGRYPNGAVRFYNKYGQALDLNGKPTSRAETHIVIDKDGIYQIPEGWNP